MKPEKNPRKVRKDKLATVNLGKMTCTQLVEWLASEPKEMESQKATRLRGHYAHGTRLQLLKLCGSLNARHHYRHCMTARHLLSVPTIEMKVAGGKPDKKTMPPFTAALKRIGEINGLVIHRWETGAFILGHPLKEQTERFALEKEV